MKDFLIFFCVQFINYGLLCINYRAVAQADYLTIAISDGVFASISFFLIRKIAKSEASTTLQWLGYVLGGICGSLLGVYLSKSYL